MTLEISGKTRLFAILADPVRQVKTPQVLNRLMRERRVDGVMVPLHVPSGGLAHVVAGLRVLENFGGAVITVPHKVPIVSFCDRLEFPAKLAGAANCIRRESDGSLVATMLDGEGFVAGLRRSGIEPRGVCVYLAGAGGAANAIAFSLAEAGVARLSIRNRTQTKSDDLARRISAAYPAVLVDAEPASVAGHDVVVNATALGMRARDPLPLDVGQLQPKQVVADIIMEPEVTPLLAAAQKVGCRIHFGRPMLESQAELMADFMGCGNA